MLDRLLEASVTALGAPGVGQLRRGLDRSGDMVTPTTRSPRTHRHQHQRQQQPTPGDDTRTAPAPPAPAPDTTTARETARTARTARTLGGGARTPKPPGDTATPTIPPADEIFHGYYLQAITSVKDEHGPPVPELARRMHLAACDHDPPAEIVPVLEHMTDSGLQVDDLLADSGYCLRIPTTWALPLRALGIDLVQDLHPNDRGPRGTHHGAICSNGTFYCPATPPGMSTFSPLPRAASAEHTPPSTTTTAQSSPHTSSRRSPHTTTTATGA